MRTKLHSARWLLTVLGLVGAFVLGVWSVGALTASQPSAVSFGTGFTYQGFLRDSGGQPITDSCDLTFRLYDALSGGSQVGGDDVISGVNVSAGLFTVVLNDSNEFGAAAVNGGGRFLEIAVQCSGDASPTTLTPRQPLNPVPYARFAERFAGYENLIIVAKQGGDFTAVTDALDAIGVDPVYPAATDTNRYLIYVAPGIYENEKIIMQPYVDIEGSGQGVTVLTSNGGSDGIKPESATLVGADNAELRHVTVENIEAGSSAWTFAIYTTTATRFTHVTAQVSGGGHARGMVSHAGGAPALRDVALISNGGSLSNVGIDIFLATALADGLFVSASGGTNAHGLFINNASETVKLENVTTFVTDGTDQTNGIFIQQSDVDLWGFDTHVSSSGDLVTGVFCTSVNSRLDARDVIVDGSKEGGTGSIRGVYATNCDLSLSDASVAVSAPSPVYGLYFNSSVGADELLEVNQLDIEAHSSSSLVNGLYTTSNTSSTLSGGVNNLTVNASGQLLGSNSHGVNHRAQGAIHYQDLAIEITGQANFMYGFQAARGTPSFRDVWINASGEAQTTVFGAEFVAPVSGGSLENAQIFAENTGTKDAVGLKSNAAESFFFHNISTRVTASRGVWGYDFVSGIVSATDLDTLVEGNADNVFIRGIRCWGGAADIHNARLTVQASGGSVTPTVAYGVFSFDCELTLTGSEARARGDSGPRYGIYVFTNAVAPTHFVRDSYLAGDTAAMRTSGYADVVMVNSQLDGGVTSSGSPNDTTTCTAVSHGSGTTFNFTAGPVTPCP